MTDRVPTSQFTSKLSAAPDTGPFNASEAAAFLGVSERTVRRAISRGQLAASKRAGTFRVDLAELLRFQAMSGRGATGATSRPPVPLPTLIAFPSIQPAQLAPLPRSLTRLLGREAEIDVLCQLIGREDVSLVTLIGPGGVGKTRLALAVAGETDVFAHGSCFVSLASVTRPDLVASEIAQAFGLQGPGNRAFIERMAPVFRDRRMLLVLDNFEHVLPAARFVEDLLLAYPGLTVLATSRAPLRVSGEIEHIVPPLSLEGQEVVGQNGVPASPAVHLFVARAQAVRADFTLTPDNVGTIATMCHALDGLPLAIELAATRLKVVTLPELLARMERRLPLLTGGGRDLPARQQTMRSTIAWSHDLLGDEEQRLFRRLSVFVGGISLAAAEAVASRIAGATTDPLTMIETLVDASLLRFESPAGRSARYLMLETIREYGHEQLAANAETSIARDAHAAYFIGLGEWLDPNILGPGDRFDDRLPEIEVEQPNLIAALTHLEETGNAGGLLELAGRCAVIWHHRGYLTEGRRWLEQAIRLAPSDRTASLARAQAGLSLIRWTQGAFAEARQQAHLALDFAITHGVPELEALARHMIALADAGDGDYQAARQSMVDALALWKALRLLSNEGMALVVMSSIEFALGNGDSALRFAEESIGLFRQLGHASGCAFGFARLAWFAAGDGDVVKAHGYYLAALREWASIGERWAINAALLGLAAVAVHQQQPETAATLLGAVEIRFEAGELVRVAGSPDIHADITERVRLALPPERFGQLRRQGRNLDLEDLLRLAADITTTPSTTRPSPGGRADTTAFGLTPREYQVLLQMIEGVSNRQIATSLFVSERTVEHHVQHILGKLGVSSRTAAVTLAIRRGIAGSESPAP